MEIKDPLLIADDESEEVEYLQLPITTGCFVSKRTIMCWLVGFGFFNVYAMRVNLSEAVEPMQNQYGWTDSQQGYVLSSFFWGYLCGQVLGAIVAEKYGGKIVLGGGILITSVLTLLLPACAHNLPLLYAVRALMGLGESVTYPAANVLYTKWAPAPERTFIVTLGSAGAYLGTAFAFPIAGYLIGPSTKDQPSKTWPSVFYFFGMLGVFWCALWFWLAASSPGEHPTIKPQERKYIEATAGKDADQTVEKVLVEKSPTIPFMAMLTSPIAWALYFNHFASNWGNYTLLTYLPKFLHEVLEFDMKHAGFVAIIPYLAMFAVSLGSAVFSDWFVRKRTVRYVRILVECTSFAFAAVFLIAAGFTESVPLAMVFLTLSVGGAGGAAASYNCCYQDYSPHYAGLFFSIGNTIANISGVIAPIVAGQILGNKDGTGSSRTEWQLIFYIAAAMYFVAAVVYVFMCKGKPVLQLN